MCASTKPERSVGENSSLLNTDGTRESVHMWLKAFSRSCPWGAETADYSSAICLDSRNCEIAFNCLKQRSVQPYLCPAAHVCTTALWKSGNEKGDLFTIVYY